MLKFILTRSPKKQGIVIKENEKTTVIVTKISRIIHFQTQNK